MMMFPVALTRGVGRVTDLAKLGRSHYVKTTDQGPPFLQKVILQDKLLLYLCNQFLNYIQNSGQQLCCCGLLKNMSVLSNAGLMEQSWTCTFSVSANAVLVGQSESVCVCEVALPNLILYIRLSVIKCMVDRGGV